MRVFLNTNARRSIERNIVILYDIRETRLVKVFFFQFRFQYTQCFIVKSLSLTLSLSLSLLSYYTIRFALEYEVTLCIIKICNIMYSKTSFRSAHCDIHGKKSCIGISCMLFFVLLDFHDGPQMNCCACCYFFVVVAACFLVTGS